MRRWLWSNALALALASCGGTRTIIVETERPASVRLHNGPLLCEHAPCRWSFPSQVCNGPFQSHDGYVGFLAAEGGTSGLTFQSRMHPLCDLDDGQVVRIPMSGDVWLTTASVEFIDLSEARLVEAARDISLGRVRTLHLLENPQDGRGPLEVEIELVGGPLKGTRAAKVIKRRLWLSHPARFQHYMPILKRSQLELAADVFVFDADPAQPGNMPPGSHVENTRDRSKSLRAALRHQ